MAAEGWLFGALLLGLWREATSLSSHISVPDRVPALLGSCVVIPCSFRPGPRGGGPALYQVRLHSLSSYLPLRRTVFSSEAGGQVSRQFRGRAALAGDPRQGDCSVRIEGVTEDDRSYYEVGVKEPGVSEWRKSKKVFLNVSDNPSQPMISDPGAVVEGQLVTLNCTISNSCPTQPPQVWWKWERGRQANESRPQTQGPPLPQGELLLSSFSFTASSQAQPRVRCEARYQGGRTVSSTRELHVRFPPKDVEVHVHTLSVQEGASALLSCSCKADPPATEFLWVYSQQGAVFLLPQRSHTVRLYNVTRDTRVRCTARSPMGQADSALTGISVQYKPVISPQSFCRWEGQVVFCFCAVDANPRAAVTWSVNRSVPPDSYNTSASVSPGNGTLSATLRGDMELVLSVTCYANNALGNDSSTLLYTLNDALLWKVLPAAGALASLLLVSALLLLLYLCHRKAGRHLLNCGPPSVYPGNLGIYQDRAPLYINCSEVTHIYTNGSYQLVYQNCTPLFVRNTQQREGRVAWSDRQPRRARTRPDTDTETHVYLEII
ncbi:Schwann cell myelin protein [Megalops cyprinoides]|uniref:Schwann cell myelin protein n=1 Tax=Megalops cyprinoides TaxID=118141 RepID=UPI00186513D3|nr:Schwann cell myelin protein [Megalops cyprinoides]